MLPSLSPQKHPLFIPCLDLKTQRNKVPADPTFSFFLSHRPLDSGEKVGKFFYIPTGQGQGRRQGHIKGRVWEDCGEDRSGDPSSELSLPGWGEGKERGLEGLRRRWGFHLGEGGFFCLIFLFFGGGGGG